MAVSSTTHVKIRGISAALPKRSISVFDLAEGNISVAEIEKIAKGVGAKKIYEAAPDQTAADFCQTAAEQLICDLNWPKDTIDGLIFASQTPDYIAPATAGILQNRLGLTTDCLAYDINFGCTGFLNGLLLASQLIELKTCKRVLVLAGDTLRRLTSRLDKGLRFVLSDGGSAVACEYSETADRMVTTMHTDGSGYKGLFVPAGGARLPKTAETAVMKQAEEGNIRCDENYRMNGMDIFSFAVKRVPVCLDEISRLARWGKEDIDYYFLHQANAYMVKYIVKRAGIEMRKCPINIYEYGNTNGTTIPLLLLDCYKQGKLNGQMNAILCAFGVGLSWGATAVTLGEDTVYSDIQYI